MTIVELALADDDPLGRRLAITVVDRCEFLRRRRRSVGSAITYGIPYGKRCIVLYVRCVVGKR